MPKRRSNSNRLMGLAVLLGAGYWLLSRRSQAATPGALMTNSQVTLPPVSLITPTLPSIPEISGAIAPTGSQVTAAQAIWQNLTPTSGPGAGYVNFPSGSQAAAVFLPWATDGSGNSYTQWAGEIYIVGEQDLAGNYPARLLGS